MFNWGAKKGQAEAQTPPNEVPSKRQSFNSDSTPLVVLNPINASSSNEAIHSNPVSATSSPKLKRLSSALILSEIKQKDESSRALSPRNSLYRKSSPSLTNFNANPINDDLLWQRHLTRTSILDNDIEVDKTDSKSVRETRSVTRGRKRTRDRSITPSKMTVQSSLSRKSSFASFRNRNVSGLNELEAQMETLPTNGDNAKIRKYLTIFFILLIVVLIICACLYFTGVVQLGNSNVFVFIPGTLLNISYVVPDTALLPFTPSTGVYGCSNNPIRAPLRSSLFYRIPSALNPAPLPFDVCSISEFRYTITECDLYAIMRPLIPISNYQLTEEGYLNLVIRNFHPHLVTALELYDLNCSQERLLESLIHLKYETNGLLTSQVRNSNNGAGALHLIPLYWARFIAETPQVLNIYQVTERSTFEDVIPLSSLEKILVSSSSDNFGMIDKIALLLSRPEITFLTLGWWLRLGAQKIDPTCGDVRGFADAVLDQSSPSAPPKDANGFYKVLNCLPTLSTPESISTQKTYLKLAKSYAENKFTCQIKDCSINK